MTTSDFIDLLEGDKLLLPQSIFSNNNEADVVKGLEEIYKNKKAKLEEDESFRSRYIEVVNYLLISNLNNDKKPNLVDSSIINYLLSFSEK